MTTSLAAIAATITDRDNAPAIRSALKKAGLTWYPRTREWVAYSPSGTRGIRIAVAQLPAGVAHTLYTHDEWIDHIN